MGRKSKLTPEVQERICQYVRQGLTYEIAARAAGVSETTFYRWKQRGERSKRGKYREFWEALKRAESEAEQVLVRRILAASNDTWQAAAWMLERRYPERWGRKDRVKHETDLGDALAQVLERLAHSGSTEDD